jgi:hypothetical protein
MANEAAIEIEEREGKLRITIPFGSRERFWMSVAITVMAFFGTMMAIIAMVALRGAGGSALLLWIPRVIVVVVILLYLLSLAGVRSTPGSLLEFDGAVLAIGSIGGEPRTKWPRSKIKSITVSRLPLVPVANLVIHLNGEPSIYAGVCRGRELEPVAQRLRDALAGARA